MATTLTAAHPRAERRFIPDGMPLDELEREMLDFAQECEAAWLELGLPQTFIVVRAWPNSRFIWTEAH